MTLCGRVGLSLGRFSLETSWDVSPGSVLILFGPSGSGKTTTLRSIVGLIQPQDGHVEVNGRVVCDTATGVWVPPHKRNLGYLPQEYHLFPHLDVEANIGYGLKALSAAARRTRVAELLRTFQIDGLGKRSVRELSSGQRQRVALARALAPRPAALLLDEPFSALDIELRRAVHAEVRRILKAAQIPVILVTHDREDALALGDAVQVIDQGRCLAQGDPLQVLGQPGQGRVARLVGVENLLTLRVERLYPTDGTMVCVGGGAGQGLRPSTEGLHPSAEGLRLEVPLSNCREGEQVTVGLRASDIILAAEEPHHSSARNRLPGVVTGVESRPPGYEVALECRGVLLRCRITGSSLAEMAIRPGQPLWAVFKASSCFLVQE